EAIRHVALLVAVDIERLLFACCQYRYRLFGQVNCYLGIRIGINGIKYFLQERGTYLYGQYTDIQAVVTEDIGKEAGYHTPEAIVVNRSSVMFTRRAGAEVFATDEALSTVGGIVQDEICLRCIVWMVPPVAEEVVAEAFPLGCLQEPRRNNLVGIYIFYGQWNRPTGQYVETVVCHVVIK